MIPCPRIVSLILAYSIGPSACSDSDASSSDDAGTSTAVNGPDSDSSMSSVDSSPATTVAMDGPAATDGPMGSSGEDAASSGTSETTSGGSDGTTTAADLDGPVVVAVLGSSTAEGKNLPDLADSWVNRYKVDLEATNPGSVVAEYFDAGNEIFEAAPLGTVSPAGALPVDPAYSVTTALMEASPDAIVLNFPSGGQVETVGVAEIVASMQLIAAAAEAEGVQVWVATSQPARDMTPTNRAAREALNDAVEAAFGDHALDFWSPLVDADDVPVHILDVDGIHPDAEGHALLFDAVVAADVPTAVLTP